jgi:preprotein translocase subunit YajC
MVKFFLLSCLFYLGNLTQALAEGPAAPAAGSGAPGAPNQPSFLGSLFPLAAMFGVVYFLMIRPQQKKMKEQQALISSLKHGDEVLTQSGILGKITGITDKVVTVEVADNVRVKMMKSQVSQVIKGQIKDLA